MESGQTPDSSGDEFFAVPIDELRRIQRNIPFDVFLRLSENNFAHVFSRTTGIDYKRLAQYRQKGVKEVFIKKSDQESYRGFVAVTVDQVLANPETAAEKKVATLINMTEQSIAELFTTMSVSEESAENARKVVKSYMDTMTQTPKALTLLLKMAVHGEYLYYHSVGTAVISIMIARASGLFTRKMVELIGLGGFLHDIGLSRLPLEITQSPKDLNPAQWKEMRMHPKLGLLMIENTPNIPDEVRYIVYQHHEAPNATGYPNGLKGSAIFYPAKLVSVADGFAALISQRAYREAYSVEQAIHILQSEKGKYDQDLVRLLGSILLRYTGQSSRAA